MSQKIQKKIDLFNCDCTSFMMVMPTHSNADENNCNNVWVENLSTEEREIDGEAAFGQWLDLYMFLANQGLVTIMPSPENKSGLADHVYAANSGIILGDTFIVSNFTSEPRRPETPVIENFAKQMGCKVVVCPFKFEGEAEMKYIGTYEGKETFLCGYGIRTDIKTYQWMEENFGIKTIPVKMTDDKLYHFDTMCFNLTASSDLKKDKANVLLCTELLTSSELEEVRKYCKIVDVPLKLAYYGITNCVRAGSYILCGSDFYDLDPELDAEFYFTERDKNQFLEDVLSEFGMEPVFFNLSEFSKAGACLSCNVCHLNRFSYNVELV